MSDGWNPIRAYWQAPTQANRDALRAILTPETTIWQYTHGVSRPVGGFAGRLFARRLLPRAAPAPTRSSSTCSATTRTTSRSIRRSRSISARIGRRFLAVWGKNDPFFLPAGAEAFKRDIPDADVRFFDTGHFALETHAEEIAAAIREFLS